MKNHRINKDTRLTREQARFASLTPIAVFDKLTNKTVLLLVYCLQVTERKIFGGLKMGVLFSRASDFFSLFNQEVHFSLASSHISLLWI